MKNSNSNQERELKNKKKKLNFWRIESEENDSKDNKDGSHKAEDIYPFF